MKKVTVTKEGYLIDLKEIEHLSGEILRNIRMNLRMLKRIGRISYNEHLKLEREIDSVLYPIKTKFEVQP